MPPLTAEPATSFLVGEDVATLIDTGDPKNQYTCSPGLCVCPNGRLIATAGIRGKLEEKSDGHQDTAFHDGYVYISDDKGQTWTQTCKYNYRHARPFVVGNRVYVLGHEGDLKIMTSDDWGQTWSEPVDLTHGESWHQAPCNVWYANGCVYLVMEKHMHDIYLWSPSVLAPITMRAQLDTDLMDVNNWTFAQAQAFRDMVDVNKIQYAGMPNLAEPARDAKTFEPKSELNGPMGWLETNVVQVMNEKHWWYDPTGKTFHLFMRYHWGGTGYAAMLKVIEDAPGQGAMTTVFEKYPSGAQVMFLPNPVGHLKFHLLYDEQTKLYWILGSQARDQVMAYDRNRLALYFSSNLINWCFAGIVAIGEKHNISRSYAAMVIDGEDLHVLSRSGSANAKSAHDGDQITFHTVPHFRNLVY
jgi:hypothetical protein